MQLTCPCCHVRYPLEAALQVDAGGELLALMSGLEPDLARPLVAYLALFRAKTTQLGWDRALRLAREVLGLCSDPGVLRAALTDTLTAMDEKRQAPGWKPLGNHNYLKRVLETAAARSAVAPIEPAPGRRQLTSKTGQALATLEDLKR